MMSSHERYQLESKFSTLEYKVKHLEKRLARLEKWRAEDGEEPEPPFSSSVTLTEDEKVRMSKKQIAFYEGKEEDDESE